MQRTHRRILSFFILGLAWGWIPAASGALRPITGGFPQLDTSARGTALGGNLVALAAGSEALYWNPAGLLTLDHKELSFTYADLFNLGLVTHTVAQFDWPHLGSRIEWDHNRIRKVPLPPPANRALGLGVSILRAGLDTSNYLEAQIALAYAWRLIGGTQAAVVYRYLSASTGADTTSDGTGHTFDFGVQRRIGGFRLGFAGSNVSSLMDWTKGRAAGNQIPEESDPLATRWSGGLAWVPRSIPLSATVQGNWAGGGFALVQFGSGLEWRIKDVLTLRGACRRREDDLGGRNEWSAGAGFQVREWKFDYGFLVNGHELGTTHRWSAAFGF